MSEVHIREELSSIKLELSIISKQLTEICSMIREFALVDGKATLEPLSVSPLVGLTTDDDLIVKMLSGLPEWATKTYVAVKEVCLEGKAATAAQVSTLTKRSRNTESSRLAALASKNLLVRNRKGRYVEYAPKIRAR